MGFDPSFQLCLRDNGKTGDDDAFPTGSMVMSNLEPFLWVLLRSRNFLSFSEMNVTMGPREGRHANGDSKDIDVSKPFLYLIRKPRRFS